MTVRYRHYGSAEDRWSRVQSTPVFDGDGKVRLAINVIEDITEIKRAEKGHRFLAEASRVLAASLDYERTLSTVARLAVPEVADWCAVDLAVGDDVERVAVAHVDPARVALARELERRYPADPHVGPGRARRAGARRGRALSGDQRRAARAGGTRPRAPRAAALGRHAVRDGRADDRARPRAGRDHVRVGRVRTAVRRARSRAGAGPRAAGRRRGRELPAVRGVGDDRAHAAAVAAAARAARAAGDRDRRRLPPGGNGPRGRRRLLRRVQHRRGPVVRRDRRRLRQGRRGRRGHRAGALHDPRRGGPAALAGRDPALAERRHARPAAGRRTGASARSRACTSTSAAHPPASLSRAAAIRCRSSCARTAGRRRSGRRER